MGISRVICLDSRLRFNVGISSNINFLTRRSGPSRDISRPKRVGADDGDKINKDIEGTTYDIGPGSVIYAPPGIASAHSWDIKEPLKLIAVRGTTDPEKTIQFDVDPVTKESRISIEHLTKRQAIDFKKSLY